MGQSDHWIPIFPWVNPVVHTGVDSWHANDSLLSLLSNQGVDCHLLSSLHSADPVENTSDELSGHAYDYNIFR